MRLPGFVNIALVAFLAGACSSEPGSRESPAQTTSAIIEIAGDNCAPLIADTLQVGTVCTSIAGDDLKITYQMSGSWALVDARMWVGTDFVTLQTDSNNYPLISQLPYQSGPLDNVDHYDFFIPLAAFQAATHLIDCEPKTIYIVPKAGVVNSKGVFAVAWGGDIAIGERALYFDIDMVCNDQPPPPPDQGPVTCETAFAYGPGRSECFINMDGLHPNRWGGNIGPLDSGTYSFELYAGAGRCDLDKATFVGWLNVEHQYSGSTRVCFEAAPGAVFEETHLYVGTDPMVRSKRGSLTVSPGLYPYVHDELNGAVSDCYDIDAAGYIYVIAHAVACYGDDPGIDYDDGYAGGIAR